MKKINVVQFLPYYPPHTGGLETHAEEWAIFWSKKGYGKVYNIVSNIKQQANNNIPIIYKDKEIGYKKDGVYVLLAPSFEIIPGFPIYKLWSKKYNLIVSYLKEKRIDCLVTRTRFFLTSLVGGLFAKRRKIFRIHIEHGSGYVKLSSRIKNIVAYYYDSIIGKWIFTHTDILVGVSNACKKFIQNKLNINREVRVVYRGLLFMEHEGSLKQNKVENLTKRFNNKLILGFIGRLYKRKNVDSLITAYYELLESGYDRLQLVIVGNGEDFERLKEIDHQNRVYFVGGVNKYEAINYQKQFDIHIHSSNPGGGLATTLLQAMKLGILIVATPYEGAKEVIKNNINGILLDNDDVTTIKDGITRCLKVPIKQRRERIEYNKLFILKHINRNQSIEKYYTMISLDI